MIFPWLCFVSNGNKELRASNVSSHISVVLHISTSLGFQGTLLGTMKTNALPVIEVVWLCAEMLGVRVKKPGSVCALNNLWQHTHFFNVCGFFVSIYSWCTFICRLNYSVLKLISFIYVKMFCVPLNLYYTYWEMFK